MENVYQMEVNVLQRVHVKIIQHNQHAIQVELMDKIFVFGQLQQQQLDKELVL